MTRMLPPMVGIITRRISSAAQCTLLPCSSLGSCLGAPVTERGDRDPLLAPDPFKECKGWDIFVCSRMSSGVLFCTGVVYGVRVLCSSLVQDGPEERPAWSV